MGYRTYFYVVDRDVLGAIAQSKTLNEAVKIAHPDRDFEEEPYTSVYEIKGAYKGFEFGKYLEQEHHEKIAGNFPKLKWFDDSESHCIVGNDNMVLSAIEYEKERILENLKKESENSDDALEGAKGRYRWAKDYLVDTDKENKFLTTSWLYEHQIFNLVNLYKNTDWKNKTVIFAGW